MWNSSLRMYLSKARISCCDEGTAVFYDRFCGFGPCFTSVTVAHYSLENTSKKNMPGLDWEMKQRLTFLLFLPNVETVLSDEYNADLGQMCNYFRFKYLYALLSLSSVLEPMKYSQKVLSNPPSGPIGWLNCILNPKQLHISTRSGAMARIHCTVNTQMCVINAIQCSCSYILRSQCN